MIVEVDTKLALHCLRMGSLPLPLRLHLHLPLILPIAHAPVHLENAGHAVCTQCKVLCAGNYVNPSFSHIHNFIYSLIDRQEGRVFPIVEGYKILDHLFGCASPKGRGYSDQ